MNRRRTTFLILGVALAAATTIGPATSATAASAETPPVTTPTTVQLHPDLPSSPSVSVSALPAEAETLEGGPCYKAPIQVVQPKGFTIARNGSIAGPLQVVYRLTASSTDVVQQQDETVVIPAGQASVRVSRFTPGAGELVTAGYSAMVLPGDGYAVVESQQEAHFEGFAGASRAGSTCGIARDARKDVRLDVGQDLHPDAFFWHVRQFRMVSGALPPGISLNDEAGPAGTPSRAGSWTAVVEECPWPKPELGICGTTTYSFTIGRRQISEDRGGVADGSTSSTTVAAERATDDPSTTTTRMVVSIDDEVTGGSGFAPIAAVGGVGALAAAAGLAALARRRGDVAGEAVASMQLEGLNPEDPSETVARVGGVAPEDDATVDHRNLGETLR